MSGWTRFVRTTVIGGILFLVPFIVVIVILGKAFAIMRHIAEPLSSIVPIETIGEIALVNVIAVALILLICFLAGLCAKAEISGRLMETLEQRFLSRIPLYHFIKGMTGSIVEAEENRSMKTVLVRLDDYSQVAFEIERTASGEAVVYLPGAPNPWSGAVCIMSADRVTPLDTSMIQAVQNIKSLGKGSKELLGNQA